MDIIWGTEHIYTGVDYIFNYKQLIIFMAIMTFCIFFSMYYYKKSERRQKIFLIIATVFLFLMETARIVWRYFYLKNTGGEITFFNLVDLNLYTVALWLSIPMLIIVVSRKNHGGKLSQTFLTFIFSVTAICALIDLIYPVNLDGGFAIVHVYNLQFMFSRAVVLLITLFIGATEWLQNSIDDIWKAILCLIVLVGVAVGIYFATNGAIDIAYIDGCPIFDAIGLTLNSPWHLVVLAVFFFCCQVLIYLPFDIYRKISINHKAKKM